MQPDLLFDPSMWDPLGNNNNNNNNRSSNSNNQQFNIEDILNNNNKPNRSQSQIQSSNNNSSFNSQLPQQQRSSLSSNSNSNNNVINNINVNAKISNNNIKFAPKNILTPVVEDKQMKIKSKSKKDEEEEEEEGEVIKKKASIKNKNKKDEDSKESDKDNDLLNEEEEEEESSSDDEKNKESKIKENLENVKEITNIKEQPNEGIINKDNPSSPSVNDKGVTNALEELHRGTALLKYPRHHGFPHFKFVQLSKDNTKIQWFSKKKPLNETCIYIKDLREIIHGQQTEPFKKYNQKSLDKASFSIIHSNKYLSLDVVAKSIDEALMWVKTLNYLKKII